MASESKMTCFRRIWLLRKFYYLVIILSMKHDVSMCNITMERKMCRLHGGIRTTRLHHLINHNINLNDPWLRTLDHNSSCHVWNSQKVKLLTTIYVIYQLISKYNYKYILVNIERGKMFEFSNFHKWNFHKCKYQFWILWFFSKVLKLILI